MEGFTTIDTARAYNDAEKEILINLTAQEKGLVTDILSEYSSIIPNTPRVIKRLRYIVHVLKNDINADVDNYIDILFTPGETNTKDREAIRAQLKTTLEDFAKESPPINTPSTNTQSSQDEPQPIPDTQTLHTATPPGIVPGQRISDVPPTSSIELRDAPHIHLSQYFHDTFAKEVTAAHPNITNQPAIQKILHGSARKIVEGMNASNDPLVHVRVDIREEDKIIETLENRFNVSDSDARAIASNLSYVATNEYHEQMQNAQTSRIVGDPSQISGLKLGAQMSALGTMSAARKSALTISYIKLYGDQFEDTPIQYVTPDQQLRLEAQMQEIINKWNKPVSGFINRRGAKWFRSLSPKLISGFAALTVPALLSGTAIPAAIGTTAIHGGSAILAYIAANALARKITKQDIKEIEVVAGHRELDKYLNKDGYKPIPKNYPHFNNTLHKLGNALKYPFTYVSKQEQRKSTMTMEHIHLILNTGEENEKTSHRRRALLANALFGIGVGAAHWDTIQAALTPYIDQLSNMHMPDFSWPICPDIVPEEVVANTSETRFYEPFAPESNPSRLFPEATCATDCGNYWPANRH